MKTIAEAVETEIAIQKSRFLSYLRPMTTISEVEAMQKELRKHHRKANHVCYAYRLGLEHPEGHFSDDGEPSQTAGLPMYTVLEGEDLTNVAVFVVRYFGGIKLGTGGLVRAYTDAVKEALKQADEQVIEPLQRVRLDYAYAYHNVIQHRLSDVSGLEPVYGEAVSWTVYLADDNILGELINLSDGNITITDEGKVFTTRTKWGILEID